MTRFRVWAPAVTRVDVELGPDGARHAMTAVGGGWHEVEVNSAGTGTDYRFVLDAGVAAPDPRSPWQPAGVHGPSRVFDHGSFDWTDGGWRGIHLPSAVFYELHVGTFSPEGTFDGAAARLDHLVSLGVDAVELLPVAQFPGARGWGYDGVDLYAPHHAYGGPGGLKRLVDACHGRGLAVVMDVVYNHLGPAGNYLGKFGPYFTTRYTTPWGSAVNLDGAGSDEVRDFFVDNALMWLRDYHVDGLRLDAVHGFVDSSATHFLEQLGVAVEDLASSLGRGLFLVAESDLNDPRVIRHREVGGFGMDAQWSDDFHHALHAVLTGERDGYYADFGTLESLAAACRRAFVYAGEYSHHRGRRHGAPTTGLSGHRFLGYLQNHDQIGNRAAGDRSAALMTTDRLKVAAAIVLTSPFLPLVFQGEEWGASSPFQYFTDHDDPDLGRAVSEGRREEFASFGWEPADVPDPQDQDTFLRSRLKWDEVEKEPHRGLLDWHRRLIGLRRRTPALTDGRLDRVRTFHDDQAGWLVIERCGVVMACNLGSEPVRLAMAGEVLLESGGVLCLEPDMLELAPDSVAIVARPAGAPCLSGATLKRA